MSNSTRRNLSLALVGGASALLVASCTQQQIDDTAKKLAEVITAIQKGVKDACTAAGVLVPTANSVLAVIAAVLGTTNPAILTATQIAQVVTAIVQQACPPGTPAGRRAEVKVNNVPVVFY